MARILDLLTHVAPDLEAQLKPQLKGAFGGLVRAYLPQTWVFVTESETASLIVGADGSARALQGAAPHPDVLVETGHARLVLALTTRDKSKVPPGVTKVTPKTEKGRTAFQFVRSRLGL
jgi:hypothetical protein